MSITITLSSEEALVLFEMLSREVDEREGEGLTNALVCQGEFWALNQLQGALERAVPEVFALDYAAQIRAARAALTPLADDSTIHIDCRALESDAMKSA